MKNLKKKSILIFIFSLFIFLLISIDILHTDKSIERENNDCYKITTDLKRLSMENDGGSNTNEYYIIDMDNLIIKKYQDKYVGFKGYKYKDKLIYRKKISKDSKKELVKLLDGILKESESKENIHDKGYYSISYKNNKEITTDNIRIKKILKYYDEK